MLITLISIGLKLGTVYGFRQNGQPEEGEAGRPRHHLIRRRPPVGRTLAPRVPRAATMHRTKHPMPFPDNDDQVM
uniref:Uncharacterized protein n=1 Tax=Acrobeloides nanus TaxID=290746 RepID=A0A914E100_9BILA